MPNKIGMDFIFGAFKEWMGVLGDRTRSTHCTLTRAEWKESLELTGYSDMLFLASMDTSVAHMAFVCQGGLTPVSYYGESSTPPSDPSPESAPSELEPITPEEEKNSAVEYLSPYSIELA